MDWAVIEIQGPGQNVIPTPSFAHASEGHVVTDFAEVSGTTEVYGVGRTSGYSLAYTSDVPGLQYFNGGYHREWTVRQHALNTVAAQQLSEGGLETLCPDLDQMKSTEEWITGGVGVPGDSGAWLMTRDGDRVIGHVWARSTSYGPINNQRLTYFTPFVDLKADIEDKFKRSLEPRVFAHIEITAAAESTLDQGDHPHSDDDSYFSREPITKGIHATTRPT
ncbi:hypothetical protein VdG1_07221 [Verticillium dahliae VDG1]|nr:hypothetical protein VdG1_07221 [Verticillium dahliae VDG1]